ncbi:MAG TPA: LysR substrate-binding domain-containing protein [Burkholderiales bacterium]|nr:LysR substrate-binding domain-containing protein [Burkholderiales bacterium]
MTLTELRYIVALSQTRHFGHAAEKCFVTQPTLSLAVKKLEDELGVELFERKKNDVIVTAAGERIVEQAKRVLAEASKISELAQGVRDPLSGPLRLGVIPTIGPYLLPDLVPILRKLAPSMPLIIEETLTENLAALLRSGEIDAAIIALPFKLPTVKTWPLYEESFQVVVPLDHPLSKKSAIKPKDLTKESLLLLNTGNCFRDQVLEACPGNMGADATEGKVGSSLETVRNMVASGLGVSVLPSSAVSQPYQSKSLKVLDFTEPVPSRRIALAARETFSRPEALDVLLKAMRSLNAPWCRFLAMNS